MKKQFIQILIVAFLISIIPFVSSNKVSAATSNEIATNAKKFHGIPYKFGGTTPSGFDCSGYIRYVFNKSNISLPRTSVDQFKVGTKVSKNKLRPGDLVFFANTYKKGISHTGIYLGNDEFISAKSRGVLKANLKTDPYWAPKYAGAKRVASIAVAPETNSAKTNRPMSEKFKDLSMEHPAYDAIIALNEMSVINGYTDATFKPENPITRGHAAAMINRVLKLVAITKDTFSDVTPNSSFSADIAALNEAGIIKGYSTGEFGVNDKLTRKHLAVIIDRAFGLKEKMAEKEQVVQQYKDIRSSNSASESILALRMLDKTEVFKIASFNPEREASRADFSAAIFSAIALK